MWSGRLEPNPLAETGLMSFVAWWGACLSTALAGVKLWELWRDRFRVSVSYNFTSDPDSGNEIFVRNLAQHPIILSYWEVLLVSRYPPFRKFSGVVEPSPDIRDFRIDAHSTYTLHFRYGDHFNWGVEFLKGRRIYIRLHVAGRRPILKYVYG